MIEIQHPASIKNNFFDLYETKLSLLEPYDDVTFPDDIWQFSYENYGEKKVTLDFRIFDTDHVRYFDTVNITALGQDFQISMKDLAKILFLKISIPTYKNNYFIIQACLSRFFAYLVACKKSGSSCDYEALTIFMITNTVDHTGIKSRLTAFIYASGIGLLKLNTVLTELKTFNIQIPLSPISEKKLNNAMNTALISAADITLKEYREGGSFNYLTLDIGKHYFDFLYQTTELHLPIATAFQSILESATELYDECKIPHSALSTYPTVRIGRLLKAIPTSEILRLEGRKKIDPKYNNYQQIEMLRIAVNKRFAESYRQTYAKWAIFKKENCLRLSIELGLKTGSDTLQCLKHLLFLIESNSEYKSIQRIFEDSIPAHTLLKSTVISFALFKCKVNKIKQDLYKKSPLPVLGSKSNNSLMLIHSSRKAAEARGLIHNVELAYKTLIISLLGWRRSEFGFSWDSLKVTQNTDSQDSHYNPLRFEMFWLIPKTNGETKLNRELTIETILLLDQLRSLRNIPSSNPIFGGENDKSPVVTSAMVLRNWWSFSEKYEPFKIVRRLKELQDKNGCQKEISRLKLQIGQNSDFIAIEDVEKKVSESVKYLTALRMDSLNKSHDTISNLIIQYVEPDTSPDMPSDIREIWDERLPTEIKSRLCDGTVNTINDINRDMINTVRTSILEGCLYPTPHALRHCWAESVYRRYSGDVGWFIRSNFKHIGNSFFMRYLRNKQMVPNGELSKRQAISSLLKNYFLSLRNNHRQYAGKMDRFLSRVGERTKAMSLTELANYANELAADEIVNITANSWSYCLVRKRAKYRSKCAIDNIPQEHKAALSLCLGCSNGLVAKENIEGIMISIAADVEVVKEPQLPFSFKKTSIANIKLAYNQVSLLYKNSGDETYLQYIEFLKVALAQTTELEVI